MAQVSGCLLPYGGRCASRPMMNHYCTGTVVRVYYSSKLFIIPSREIMAQPTHLTS
eukprot:SAG11_NODE_57_length_19200_cov_18.288417_20_plen_55_part_01